MLDAAGKKEGGVGAVKIGSRDSRLGLAGPSAPSCSVALSQTGRLAGPPFLHQQKAAIETLKNSLQNLPHSINVSSCSMLNFQEYLASFGEIFARRLGPGILKAHG